MKIINFIIFFFLINKIYALAQDSVSVSLNANYPNPDSTFEMGQPIIFDLEFTNKTDSIQKVCTIISQIWSLDKKRDVIDINSDMSGIIRSHEKKVYINSLITDPFGYYSNFCTCTPKNRYYDFFLYTLLNINKKNTVKVPYFVVSTFDKDLNKISISRNNKTYYLKPVYSYENYQIDYIPPGRYELNLAYSINNKCMFKVIPFKVVVNDLRFNSTYRKLTSDVYEFEYFSQTNKDSIPFIYNTKASQRRNIKPYTIYYSYRGLLKDKFFTHLMWGQNFIESNIFYSKENINFFLQEIKNIKDTQIMLYNLLYFLHRICGTTKTGIGEPLEDKEKIILNLYSVVARTEHKDYFKNYLFSLLTDQKINKIIPISLDLEQIYNQIK